MTDDDQKGYLSPIQMTVHPNKVGYQVMEPLVENGYFFDFENKKL
jgi:hypothetical protein